MLNVIMVAIMLNVVVLMLLYWWYYAEWHYAECQNVDCHNAQYHMMVAIMLNVIMLNVTILSILKLVVIMLSVVAPEMTRVQNDQSWTVLRGTTTCTVRKTKVKCQTSLPILFKNPIIKIIQSGASTCIQLDICSILPPDWKNFCLYKIGKTQGNKN
jgi:hypothetical protein